jgi:hypothetical protein
MARGSKTARHRGDHGLGPYPAARTLPTARERIAEIAEILASGLMRLRARKSSQISPDLGEISLDILAHQSGADPNIARENRP